jgi:hypothetical protein
MRKVKIAVLSVSLVAIIGAGLMFGVAARPAAPDQPIAYSHFQHVGDASGPQLDCDFCHQHAGESRYATIPNVTTCMACHESVKADSPDIQKLAGYAARGEQPPWKRVYWFESSADVFFTHKPHVKAGLECVTCHGQVPQMRVMRREVTQTMGWCMDCHQQMKVSNDCYTCHR